MNEPKKEINIMYKTDNPNELMHYGVPGMKWGIRRSKSNDVRSKAQKNKTTKSEPVKKTSISDKVISLYEKVKKTVGQKDASQIANDQENQIAYTSGVGVAQTYATSSVDKPQPIQQPQLDQQQIQQQQLIQQQQVRQQQLIQQQQIRQQQLIQQQIQQQQYLMMQRRRRR